MQPFSNSAGTKSRQEKPTDIEQHRTTNIFNIFETQWTQSTSKIVLTPIQMKNYWINRTKYLPGTESSRSWIKKSVLTSKITIKCFDMGQNSALNQSANPFFFSSLILCIFQSFSMLFIRLKKIYCAQINNHITNNELTFWILLWVFIDFLSTMYLHVCKIKREDGMGE